MSIKECDKVIFKTYNEFKKKMYPKLHKKEQETKKFTKESWGHDLWELFEKGFENFN